MNNQPWWRQPTIEEMEEAGQAALLTRGNEAYFQNGGVGQFAGMPVTGVPINQVIANKDWGYFPRQARNIMQEDLSQLRQLFNPETYDLSGKDAWQRALRAEEARRVQELGRADPEAYAKAVGQKMTAPDFKAGMFGGGVKRARAEAAQELGEQSAKYADTLADIASKADDFKPGTFGTAMEVGGKLGGKALKGLGYAMPVINAGYQIHHEINPVEAAIRGGLEFVGSAAGMALGGSLGAATAPVTGPVGAVAGTFAGSMAGATAADWVADRIFGDEAPRIQAVKERRAMEDAYKKDVERWYQQGGIDPTQASRMAQAARQTQSQYQPNYLANQFIQQPQRLPDYTDPYITSLAVPYI